MSEIDHHYHREMKIEDIVMSVFSFSSVEPVKEDKSHFVYLIYSKCVQTRYSL